MCVVILANNAALGWEMTMKMMKLVVAVLACLGFSGCYVEEAQAQPLQQGCVLVEDATYGETMVCNAYYTTVANSVVLYDPYYQAWIGSGSYWSSGRWYAGRPYGWGTRWGGVYGWRSHGYYYGHGWRAGYGGRGYYGGHIGGGRGWGGHGGRR